MKIVNWEIISHPMNWLTILVMLVIAGIAGHLVLQWLGKSPATGGDDTITPPYQSAPNSSAQ